MAHASSSSSSSLPLTFTGGTKEEEYELVLKGLEKFFDKYTVDTVGRMATVNSYLKYHFPRMWFVGFYTVKEQRKTLQIGPYQGAVLACGLIDWGKGVCGTAALTGETQIVDDVSKCDNYIACDEDTKSEIVLPVFGNNAHNEPDAAAAAGPSSSSSSRRLIAVLDIDADIVAAFDATDKKYLQMILEKYF